MGTTLDIAVEAETDGRALEASEEAVREVERIESLLSTRRVGGPLALLNAAPVDSEVRLGAEVSGVLQQVFDWSVRTGGAFDSAAGALVACWGLRGEGRSPGDAEIERAKAACGPEAFRIDPERASGARLARTAAIEEGAWGKGYAIDRATALVAGAGIRRVTFNFGGHIHASGNAGGEEILGVADPRDRGEPAVSVLLRRGSLSTSGNSERAVGANRAIGHLLDPRTGRPAPDFGSVTVMAESALVADILSTALFVLGPERGRRLCERLRAEGAPHEVLFLIDDGGMLRAIHSPEFPIVSQSSQIADS